MKRAVFNIIFLFSLHSQVFGVRPLNSNLPIIVKNQYPVSNSSILKGATRENNLFVLSKLIRHSQSNQLHRGVLRFKNIEWSHEDGVIKLYADSLKNTSSFPVNPILPSGKNRLTFHFSNESLTNPTPGYYKYKMEGHEDFWAQASGQNIVSYTNLQPGRYIFKVVSLNHNAEWSEVPLTYAFIIESPFYHSNTFIIILITIIIALILLIIYLRVNYKVDKAMALEKIKQEENAKLRKEIGRDFHDDMGNRLARIINFVGLAKLNKDEVDTTLNKVEEAAKDLLTGTKDFIWALDPINDNVNNLFAHVRDFGDWFFRDSGISFVAINNTKEDQLLPFGHGRQINLILKESLTNCFKHAKADQVILKFEQKDSNLFFEVRDNGIGISVKNPEANEGGISNIMYRAKRIGGIIRISDSKGKGTKIELILETKKFVT